MSDLNITITPHPGGWLVSQDGYALLAFGNFAAAEQFAAELRLEQIEQGLVEELVSEDDWRTAASPERGTIGPMPANGTPSASHEPQCFCDATGLCSLW